MQSKLISIRGHYCLLNFQKLNLVFLSYLYFFFVRSMKQFLLFFYSYMFLLVMFFYPNCIRLYEDSAAVTKCLCLFSLFCSQELKL